MRVTWYGHAAFKVEIGGKKFLIDPWISNPKSPLKNPAEVGDIDYIIVTHDHGDHLGDAVSIMRFAKQAKLIAIFEIANKIARELGSSDRVIDANIGGPIRLEDGFWVVLTPAYHSSDVGHPTGAVFGNDKERAYHAGDTGLFYDMKLIGELYRPKVAMLPIGGHYTMGPREAAKAAELIMPEYVIPMHYGTFPVLWGKPEEFEKYVREFTGDRVKVRVLRPGETVEL